MQNTLLEKLKNRKAFIFDIDGVLTSGSVLVTEEGHMLRTVNIKDGYALQHAVKQGVIIGIISGGKSEGMLARFKGLGIEDIFIGQHHKEEAFQKILAKHNLKAEEVFYMGDDMPDYELLKKVGMPACPSDAAQDIREICEYVSNVPGGHGCVREVLERYMKLRDMWWNEDSHTW